MAVRNRRLFLVILDGYDRAPRRAQLSITVLKGLAAIITTLVLLFGLIVIQGARNTNIAEDTAHVAQENKRLRTIIREIENRLPQGQMLELRAELAFAQLWSKSDLSFNKGALGIGPLDTNIEQSISPNNLNSNIEIEPIKSRVLAIAPTALPQEFDRLRVNAQALQISLDEMIEYFHDTSLLLSNTPSISPVENGFITSPFGRRLHPITHQIVMHKGLDIGGQLGTDIIAPADGTVIFIGVRDGYGLTVVIDHGYGLQTHYAHLSIIKVKKGQRLQRGELIAAMGATGRATGCHLHYEVRYGGQPLNPIRFILD
ncbi:MAG: M23 family metallopeptidase [Deltaproteobacteria bacterium]|nr:M23 family metallopeptidase [Deltaproteobacteria bacterium]